MLIAHGSLPPTNSFQSRDWTLVQRPESSAIVTVSESRRNSGTKIYTRYYECAELPMSPEDWMFRRFSLINCESGEERIVHLSDLACSCTCQHVQFGRKNNADCVHIDICKAIAEQDICLPIGSESPLESYVSQIQNLNTGE